jgi:hypothetical protein
MRRTNWLLAIILGAFAVLRPGLADSFTGTFTTPEETFETTVAISGVEDLTLQTWGFGGGINTARMMIPSGGFDPLVAVFEGTGASAVYVVATSDTLSNYGNYVGCPPSGLVTIGFVPDNCGDVRMELSGLAAGTYTVLLSDADYIPNAYFGIGTTLGDGFTDLTTGSLTFQTCVDANDCNIDTASWAIDVSVSGSAEAPEPASWTLMALVLVGSVIKKTNKERQSS